MSAYIVSRGHIRFLVEAALQLRPEHCSDVGLRRYYHAGESHDVNELTANALGLMLWNECRASVRARYPGERDSALPGPVLDGPRCGYAHEFGWSLRIDPVQVLKAVACYEYQSCEHAAWVTSAAFAFCDALRCHAIRCLPGYDDAAWGCPEAWESLSPNMPANVIAFST